MKKKWYKTTWGVILLLVLFYPAGLFFMWKDTKWKPKIKWSLTGLFVILFFGFGMITTSKESALSKKYRVDTTPNQTAQVTEAPTSVPTIKPVEKYNVVVTSQIVKKVNGKYRYFFDIRNKDTKPFEGSVSISLFTAELPNAIAGDTFNTKQAIEPDLGTSVYTEANTGPTSVHGADGITKFKYTVRKGNDIVNSGEGEITTKFEDVDSYGF